MEIALLLALTAAFLMAAGQADFSETCAAVRADTVRLHVVAHSDSAADQSAKLAVRDGVLALCETLTVGCRSDEEVRAVLSDSTDAIAQRADETLTALGLGYGARAYVTDMFFDQRSYGSVTLPAGRYAALRVELGAGAGHNWWCMVYPGVCFAAAEEEAALADYDPRERQVVLGGQRYALRFKLEEWLQTLRT